MWQTRFPINLVKLCEIFKALLSWHCGFLGHDAMQSCRLGGYRRFGGTNFLHIQGMIFLRLCSWTERVISFATTDFVFDKWTSRPVSYAEYLIWKFILKYKYILPHCSYNTVPNSQNFKKEGRITNTVDVVEHLVLIWQNFTVWEGYTFQNHNFFCKYWEL
jgi:hypothetical protein